MKLLLNDERVDINKVDNDGNSPFYLACYYGHIDIVKLLLNEKRTQVNTINDNGETPFYTTCKNGKIEILKVLLNDPRVNINEVNASKHNRTPLHVSCLQGEIQVVKYILASGRDVSLSEKDEEGKTAINIAREGWKFIEIKRDWERRKRNCIKIVELMESFERNPNETRFKLRIQLGLTGNNYFLFLSF